MPEGLFFRCICAIIALLQLLEICKFHGRGRIILARRSRGEITISTDEHEKALLAQNMITFRRITWKETMLNTIAAGPGNFDISAIQLATLFLLAGEETLTIKRVAELLERSVSATSRMLDQLVTRGLVSRNEDARDRRTKLVALSDEGRAFVQAIEKKRVEAQIAVMAYLSTEERAIVEQAMQLLATAARRHADEQARSNRHTPKSAEERQPAATPSQRS